MHEFVLFGFAVFIFTIPRTSVDFTFVSPWGKVFHFCIARGENPHFLLSFFDKFFFLLKKPTKQPIEITYGRF